MFIVVLQQLRYYIVAIRDVLPYVTSALTSGTFVEHATHASKNINFPHLYEERNTYV